MLLRQQGKLIFATMRDRDAEIQLFVSRAVVGDDAFTAFGDLDLGDWVGAEGTVMTTRKGELSVKVERFTLLSKAVRPLPDKWKGLTDQEARVRARYVDLAINTEVLRLTEFANRLDLPSITLPGSRADPQPIGLMLTGRRGGDEDLLDLAVAVEALLDDR